MKKANLLQFSGWQIKPVLFGLITALTCMAGYGHQPNEPPQNSLDSIPLPKIENIQILCHDCKAILSWEVKGSADYYRVNCGDGLWLETDDTSMVCPATRHLADSAIEIQGVSHHHGGGVTRFVIADHYMLGYVYPSASYFTKTLFQVAESCTKRGLKFAPTNSLKPIISTLSLDGYNLSEAVANGTTQMVVDLNEVPATFDVSARMTLTLQWRCALTDGEETGHCPLEKTSLRTQSFTSSLTYPFHYGPENLTWECLKEGIAGHVLLGAHWEHQLNIAIMFLGKAENFIYHVEVIDDENIRVNYTIPFNVQGFVFDQGISNANNFESMPQSTNLTLQRGHAYQVSITPDYIDPDLSETLCKPQTLTRKLIIPAEAEIIQIDEVTFNDEDSTPCWKDIMTSSLTPIPSPTVQSESAVMTNEVVYSTSTPQSLSHSSVDGSESSMETMLPSMTPLPAHIISEKSQTTNTYLPIIAVYVGGVVVVSAVFVPLGIYFCIRHKPSGINMGRH